MSEPHTSELAGGFSICMYGMSYVRDSVYLYDLFKRHPISGALPQVWARDQLAWVRGQEHISCRTWRINELNCKIMDREKLTGLGVLLCNSQCCSASLAHARPTMFYIPPSL